MAIVLNQCPICEGTLTLNTGTVRNSCNDPSHWQAAGLISPKDYYTMAKVAARATVERGQRTTLNQEPQHS